MSKYPYCIMFRTAIGTFHGYPESYENTVEKFSRILSYYFDSHSYPIETYHDKNGHSYQESLAANEFHDNHIALWISRTDNI